MNYSNRTVPSRTADNLSKEKGFLAEQLLFLPFNLLTSFLGKKVGEVIIIRKPDHSNMLV